jgi:TolB-like protein/DNA-binding winged helix-turn-helix (wHTH) protein
MIAASEFSDEGCVLSEAPGDAAAVSSASDGEQPIRLASKDPFAIGALAVDPAMRRIIGADGSKHQIEPRAMQVLVALIEAQGAVVSRATINRRCWDGRTVTDDALDRVIAKLRRDAPGWGEDRLEIVTIPRVGFRIPPIAAAPPAENIDTGRSASAGVSRRTVMAAGVGTVVAGAAAAGVLLYDRSGPKPSAAGAAVRVAVLPFDNLSGDQAFGYLAAGIARQIRDQLARVAGLRVVAEASSSSVSAGVSGARERGERLGADYLVQGSVRQAGGRVRIGAALIEAASGNTLWMDEREGAADGLFALQDVLTGAILRELVGRAGIVGGTVVASRPVDGRVFRMLLEGENLFEECRSARMNGKVDRAFDCADRAESLARQALAIDPQNPTALLLVARLVRYGWTRALASEPVSPEQRVAASLPYITRALTADPNDPAALTALGDYYRRYEWRWREAETLFRKALAINPSYIEAHWSYGYQLGTTGRALEGLRHAAIVYQLDIDTTWRRVALPRLLYLVGDRAAAASRYAVELAATPANIFLIVELYIVALSEGDAIALDRLASRVRTLNSVPHAAGIRRILERLAQAAAALRGQPQALIATVDADVAAFDRAGASSLAGEARVGSDLLYIYAIEYAWADAEEAAIRMFKRAFAARSLYWPATLPFGIAPLPASLRDNPRYRAIWSGDPAMERLLAMRHRAIDLQQMAGRNDNDMAVRPSPAAIAFATRRI